MQALNVSAAFQGPKKGSYSVSPGHIFMQPHRQEIARLSAAPFGADSTRSLSTLTSLLLMAGRLVFLLCKRNRCGNKPSFDPTAGFLIWRPRLFIFIAFMIGLAHLFSIPLWPGSAPARPTQGQLHSSPFEAAACGQSQNVYRT
ncbi:hypothetical protein B0H13DRAFT_2370861 [Mycena leptocephala]|nr:hypothetical protein B0H13DRAFT_2370861 [Mycena leptocephala]